MGVSKYRGTPKWMVKIMEHPIQIPWIWGVFPPTFGGPPILGFCNKPLEGSLLCLVIEDVSVLVGVDLGHFTKRIG